ncbi:MAG: pentapeptide repeat-containing protein [Deltaproteobacteria bacterium]|nr:pentapeptide repeat-containing protein [Deltaproteobacteria bacterium]
MSRNALMNVVVAMVIVGVAGAASANNLRNGTRFNGTRFNSSEMNGTRFNGTRFNSAVLNGTRFNSPMLNGTRFNNVALSGTLLTGSLIASPDSTCRSVSKGHDENVQGVPLPASCSACATMVCGLDSYCCTNWWDGYCVAEANDWCQMDSRDLIGAEMTVDVVNANDSQTTSTVKIRFDNVEQSPLQGDVYLHTVSYFSAGHYEYRCNFFGGCYLAWVPDQWLPICPFSDQDGRYNKAVAVKGAWESREGYQTFVAPNGQAYSGGGLIPGTQGSSFTFACTDGTISKCVERSGYKPWYGASYDTLHQTCVRAMRADYCGDGHSFTRPGTEINIYDYMCIEQDTAGWYGDASWDKSGAICFSFTPRYSTDSAGAAAIDYAKNRGGRCAISSISIDQYCVPGNGLGSYETVMNSPRQVLMRTESRCLNGTSCY